MSEVNAQTVRQLQDKLNSSVYNCWVGPTKTSITITETSMKTPKKNNLLTKIHMTIWTACLWLIKDFGH
jgi:hypothetical protein